MPTPNDMRALYSDGQINSFAVDKIGQIWVSSHGAKGDGSDESEAIQKAFDAAKESGRKEVNFVSGKTYSFKNVTVSSDVIIKLNGCKLVPLRKVSTANAHENMLTFSDLNYVRIDDTTVEGDNSIVNQSGDKFVTSSVFMFTRVKKVILNRPSFSKLDCSWRANTPTNWYDRRGLAVTFLDCDEIYMNDPEVFNNTGDEWIWRIYKDKTFTDGMTSIIKGSFHDNGAMGASCFGIIGGKVYLDDTQFYNYTFTGSLVNVFGTHVFAHENKGYNLNVNSIFDTCEGYTAKNEYVECVNNYMLNTEGNIGVQMHTRKATVRDNYWATRNPVQYLIYPSSQAITRYSDAATRYTYESVRIIDNEFYDESTGAAPLEDNTMIVIGKHSGYTIDEGIRMDLCEIRGNIIKSKRTDAWEPVYIYVLANTFEIFGNKMRSMGLCGGTTDTLAYIRIRSTNNTAAIIKAGDNMFTCENYTAASYTKHYVVITTGTANTVKLYFNDNVTNIVNGSAVALLVEQFGAGTLAADNDSGFKT